MGKHSDPARHDTNPLHGLFRKDAPRHVGDDETDPVPPHTVEPIERTDGDGWPVQPVTDVLITPDDPAGSSYPPVTGDHIRDMAYMLNDLEDVDPNPRPRWLIPLCVCTALCALALGFWGGRATAAGSPVSDDYSAVPVASTATATATETVTAAPRKSGARPRPTVTEWRTRTPAPKIIVSRVPVPGPKVTSTRTVTPKPVISRVPVPAETCVITIEVERGEEISRSEDGAC